MSKNGVINWYHVHLKYSSFKKNERKKYLYGVINLTFDVRPKKNKFITYIDEMNIILDDKINSN